VPAALVGCVRQPSAVWSDLGAAEDEGRLTIDRGRVSMANC
jgi:hypothetical protein